MSMYGMDDTIAAISTPVGEGGIGIVRISGPKSLDLVTTLFVTGCPDLILQSHRLYYGHIVDPSAGRIVDEVLLSYMQAPHSYTREDVVEINCHGGIMPLQEILGLCLRQGARQALPGEFTLRAFLNGRLDLSQAEAVLDVIQSKTEAGLRAALGQLDGRLSERIKAMRGRLLGSLAYLTATIDFTEQEIPPQDIGPGLVSVREELQELLHEADRGIIYRHGVRAAIVGRPNVGKSSLLNALLRVNRAIVTPVPGTTRDTLEETLNLRGVPVVLVDTAGFNEQAQGVVEQLGIERSRVALEQADLALWVVDGSQPLTEADWAMADLLPQRPVLILINKMDLPAVADTSGLIPSAPRIHISALTGEGLSHLEGVILETVFGEKISVADTPLVNSRRHKSAIERALNHLRAAVQSYEEGWPSDFTTIDLTSACDELGEITGETVTEDLLETIFGNFCIGK